MIIKSDRFYIDYLDYTVSGQIDINKTIDRLRFDLLLFSEAILCISVPACIKLSSSANLLMKLTTFWNNGKIQLILNEKHRNNPFNYFINRKRILESGFSEKQLENHFEYTAYNSLHTDVFYKVFIREVLKSNNQLYIGKIFDTDELFRQAVITQANTECNTICPRLSIPDAIHFGKLCNDLTIIANDRRMLFQRSAIETHLMQECGATDLEMRVFRQILDKGFAYANGVSSYASPLSLISNRLTAKTFIPIIKGADIELYDLIHRLDWESLYRLSVNDTWLDFVDHVNTLLLFYQYSKKHRESIYSPTYLQCGSMVIKLIRKLYETAISSIKKELITAGAPIITVIELKDYSNKAFEQFLSTKNDYINVIKEINDLMVTLKGTIKSIERKYKNSAHHLLESGFIITM